MSPAFDSALTSAFGSAYHARNAGGRAPLLSTHITEHVMTEPPPNDLVNLFMGTAGDHGQLYPGAEMPFGLVKLAPDTYPGAVTGSAHAGYDFDDRRVLGFSHLRWSGVGNVGVGGNLLIQPTWHGKAGTPDEYNTPLDKASEEASPGYYRVTLGDPPIDAELTATDHVGLHRYTFRGEGTPPHPARLRAWLHAGSRRPLHANEQHGTRGRNHIQSDARDRLVSAVLLHSVQ